MTKTICRCAWVSLAVAMAGCACAAPGADSGPPAPVFPFVLPWDDASPGVTDLSGWLHQPAGKFGPIRVGEDGHFYAGEQRIRFFGVNLSFSGGMPSKTDAPKVTGRLAKFGVNIVRFHHLDTGAWPNGIRPRDARGSGELDPEALDRLDNFISELKSRGLYANLNLLVGRPFNAADGLPPEIEKLDWKDRHIIGFFDATQLELQKQYARRLLTHLNPYTKLAYHEDPVVAFVEINNEQGLVHAWLGDQVDRLPEVFLMSLRRQWNDWLQQRHATTAKLQAVWSAGTEPLGAELLANADFARQLERWELEAHSGSFTPKVVADAPVTLGSAIPAPKAVQFEVNKPAGQSWHLQFNQAGFRLRAGQSYTLRFWAKSATPRALAVSVGQAHEPWENLGLSANAQAASEWQEFRYVFNASQSDERARVSFSNFGPAGATVTLAGISLRPGGVAGLKPGERLEEGSLPLFDRKTFGERAAEAQRDWMRFLEATEDHYWQAMYRFLKEELKVQALIAGTIVGCSPPNLMAKMDWVDTHSYWQHPRFPRRPWDSADWIVENRSMVNERGGTLPGLALKRILGKPHACTEYNHPAPNTFGSEGFLLLAAYAALQDWDAVYVYSYAHARTEGWDSRRINSFFDIDQHPTKMATLAAAAAMFRRGDVQPARQQIVAELNQERELDLLRRARAWSLVDAGQAGVPREAALIYRVALATKGQALPPGALRPEEAKLEGNRFVSDTGELVWDLSESNRGVVTVNTARSKMVIGYGGGRRFVLGDVAIEPGQSMQNGWCAITITATDAARPPKHLLVTATGYAENTGMIWKDAEKSSVGRDWGKAPSRVEGLPARITLPLPASQVRAWVLDERGQHRKELPVEKTPEDKAVLALGPQWQTLWYEVSVK